MSFRGLEGASFPVTECLLRFRVGFRSSLQVHLSLVEKKKKKKGSNPQATVNVREALTVSWSRNYINWIQGRSITRKKIVSKKIQRNIYILLDCIYFRFFQNFTPSRPKRSTYIFSQKFQSTLVTQIRQPRVHLRDKNSSVSPHVVVNLYVNRSQGTDREKKREKIK